MLTGTLVTIAGFVPIGFARSGAGEYTFSIFAVVAIALIASWCVAVLFSPFAWRLDSQATQGEALRGAWPGHACLPRPSRAPAMRARWATILVTLGLFGAALYGMRFVPQQFFPSSDRPELLVDLQLPENASIYATKDVSALLDKLLKDDHDVDRWSTNVGRGAVRFLSPPSAFSSRMIFSPRPSSSRRDSRTARAREGEARARAGDRFFRASWLPSAAQASTVIGVMGDRVSPGRASPPGAFDQPPGARFVAPEPDQSRRTAAPVLLQAYGRQAY